MIWPLDDLVTAFKKGRKLGLKEAAYVAGKMHEELNNLCCQDSLETLIEDYEEMAKNKENL